ncbi:DEAD/DEAH box helicase [Zavarzinella formosa]|uniref:DEAD/DEAH box helicase n=1 Tax=Zavarzinella formosa TaxID=360055 RepID=UPI00031EAD45|nr:DEAD/DEAH box helicase [Zavarzinella formosa]
MPFKSLGLHPLLIKATKELEYAEPTPVQAGAIPPALLGKDVLATAQTGTGKTAAFLLPILHRMIDQPRGVTRAVIISPTRELAGQIEDACRGFSAHTGIKSAIIVGGRPVGPQERALKAGPDIVVATPGRLLDLMSQMAPRFATVSTLVLDEADSMLDMGFLPDVKRIVSRLPGRKQTLLFSATMPPVIAKLAAELLKNPVAVEIGKRTATAVGITQAAYPVPQHLKTALLRYLLRHTEMPSVLVFTRTKHEAKKLARVVAADGFTVAELHSNRTPAQRTKAMEGFKRGACQIMVATNIAARGLDVAHVTHVISTDVPDVPEDYIHRIGRTGRAGAEGDAFILVSPAEESSLARIERQVGQRLPRVSLPDFDYKQAPPPSAGGGGRSNNRGGSQRPAPRKGPVGGAGRPPGRRQGPRPPR